MTTPTAEPKKRQRAKRRERPRKTGNPFLDSLIRAVLPRPSDPYREPLGRKEGESLDPQRFTTETLDRMKSTFGPTTWAGPWQQDPQAEGTGKLRREYFTAPGRPKERHVLNPTEFESATPGLLWVRYWDLAYTAQQTNKPDPDWTVGTLMAFKMHEWEPVFDVYIADQRRFRKSWGHTKDEIVLTAFEDGPSVYIGAEGNGPQKAAVEDLRLHSELMAYHVYSSTDIYQSLNLGYFPDTDSSVDLWASRSNDGRLWIQEGAWNGAFYDEVEVYPNGSHDDTLTSIGGGYWFCAFRQGTWEPGAETVQVDFRNKW